MMELNLFEVIVGLLSVGMAVFGWFARELWGMVKELKDDVAKLRESIPEKYVAKIEYKEDLQEVKQFLVRIETKLDGKADK